MKKIIGIIFLSLILLQVAGSYAYFIVRLCGIRQEMREQLRKMPDEQLTLLTFTQEEFRKAKVDDHEVKVNGKMYDIARMIVQKDNVLLYAIHDEAEDNLLALLNEMVKRSSKDKKPLPSQLIQFLALQFVIIENKIPTPDAISVIHTTLYSASSLAFIRGIESPPPRG